MATYLFGRCELDTDRRRLLVAGIPRHVEPQTFDLLTLLVERGDRVASRDELIERVWRGRIVSDSAVSVRVNAARRAIGDDGRRQAIIRTVPRRGFRLAVVVTRAEPPGPDAAEAGGAPPAGARPVLAVFPFAHEGDGDDREYLARGIADDIATELSRFHTLAVLSTFTTFRHDPAAGGIGEFAASLGATHVVTGSVRAGDAGLRLTVRLDDAATRGNLWSERYDVGDVDVFEAQDDAVSKIVGNLFTRLHEHQMAAARHKPTTSLSAYDCVLRGLKIYKGGQVTREEAIQALFWFDRALALDPHYPRALAWRACAAANLWTSAPSEEELAAPLESMKLALSIDPGDHEVHRIKGALHVLAGAYELGDYHLSKSVELNPNDAHILLRIGWYRSFLGDRRNDLEYVDLAFARNPLHPGWYWHDRGVVLFAHGEYREALANLERCDDPIEAGDVYRAACHAALGQHDAATAAVDRARRRHPGLDRAWVRQACPYRCYRKRRDARRLDALLRAAGLN